MKLWQEEDYGKVADKACWAMFAVTTLIVGLRVLCRAWYGKARGGGLGMDDYITVGCLVVFLASCIVVTIGSSYGLGKHAAVVPQENLVPAMKYNVIVCSILIWTFTLPKFAIISTLQRILSLGTKTKILFWGLCLSSQACILATSIWWFKQCDPVERGWDRSIPGTCAPLSVLVNLGYFTTAYAGFLDIFFAIYPIPFIMRLNMPLKIRLAVSTALGLSFLGCVVSIYKLVIFGEVFALMEKDPTYPVPYLDILAVAEGMILIICASLPTLGPLFQAAKTKISDGSRGTHGTGNHFEGSAAGSSVGRSRNWDHQKLDSDVGEQASLHMCPSYDAIPLVTTHKKSKLGCGDVDRDQKVYKTVEVKVSSTAHHG